MPKVKFQNTGEEAEAEKGADLMEVTKNQGWPIAYGCEDGMCGTCIVKIIEGKENLNPLDEKEKQTLDVMGMDDGEHRLACQCKVNGDIVIEGM
ncbi:2Fe-2S iron-sulfur cluster binding domain-containing protein [Candidatus Peregrinibacteria bacterium]|nr:2Fe-2S iron-sulfur cluster binding domain-containing protein [Candidatus Peregrinibacteria bacterium]